MNSSDEQRFTRVNISNTDHDLAILEEEVLVLKALGDPVVGEQQGLQESRSIEASTAGRSRSSTGQRR